MGATVVTNALGTGSPARRRFRRRCAGAAPRVAPPSRPSPPWSGWNCGRARCAKPRRCGGLTEAVGADARDGVWQHPDLLPSAGDLDEPAGFIDRMIGGDTSGIDQAIADLEKGEKGPETGDSDS